MRLAPINGLTGRLLDFGDSSTDTDRYNIGTHLFAAPTDGVDTGTNVPNWGLCELVWVRSTSASTFNPGRILHLDKDFQILDMPNTANTGRPVYISLTKWAAGNVTTQFGWVLRSGICPVQYSVAATTGAVYFAAAGQATPTPTAGKQILNATCLIAAASAFTRSISTQNGSSKVQLARVNGVFFDITVSGTGVPASTEVSAINPSGNEITINNAATATGTVTGTFTPTGYGICQIDRAFVQGQIT